jgi:23S rRNA (adenine(2503)-C(2))-methyltransferase
MAGTLKHLLRWQVLLKSQGSTTFRFPGPKMRKLDPLPLLDEGSLTALFSEYGVKPGHAGRLWRYFLDQPDGDFANVHDLPRRVLAPLEDNFARITSTVVRKQESIDGTIKLLVKLQDGHEVESVIIPHACDETGTSRVTLCVSSQIGCRMACAFCATGTLGHSGDLYAGEILEQLWHAKQVKPEISNVVFMGMGEPLENYSQVISAIRGMTDPFRFNLAPRAITVSTVGVVTNIERLMTDAPAVKLALSLHAPTQELRERIVPTAKAWPLDALMRAIDRYSKKQGEGKKKGMVMIEYVVLKGVNDSRECAHQLGRLMRSRKVVVNLIPFNPFEGNPYETPEEEAVAEMLEILISYQIRAYVRKHHGRDIAAACGQLAKIERDGKAEIEDIRDPLVTPESEPEPIPEPKVRKERSMLDNLDIYWLSDPVTRTALIATATLSVAALAVFHLTRKK